MLELADFIPYVMGSVVIFPLLMDTVRVGLQTIHGDSMPFSEVGAGSGASAIAALALGLFSSFV